MKSVFRRAGAAAAVLTCTVALVGLSAGVAVADAPLAGSIFTTNVSCTGVNINIFSSKDAVYLDGGPQNEHAAGLTDGVYYVQVTEPNGTVLGTSVGSATPTPVTVSGGQFAQCYQLSNIVFTPADLTVAGYNTTSNPGGEYKVWVSKSSGFAESASKTDNFRINETTPTPPQATLNVNKFYDANANGLDDDSIAITGWKVRIQDNIDFIRFTPVTITVAAPDDYTVTEFAPIETNWVSTTTNPVLISLADGDNKTVTFGNLCLGAGGGLTLGFWSNKNGQALVGADDLSMLVGLNLRNANGSAFDPANYAALRTWLLNATATNMAYMLSAQLATMELNVFNGKVSGTSLVYAPGSHDANSLGFITVNALMNEANTALGANGNTVAASADRSYQEALKNALDNANNNKNFVQAAPCAFSFAQS